MSSFTWFGGGNVDFGNNRIVSVELSLLKKSATRDFCILPSLPNVKILSINGMQNAPRPWPFVLRDPSWTEASELIESNLEKFFSESQTVVSFTAFMIRFSPGGLGRILSAAKRCLVSFSFLDCYVEESMRIVFEEFLIGNDILKEFMFRDDGTGTPNVISSGLCKAGRLEKLSLSASSNRRYFRVEDLCRFIERDIADGSNLKILELGRYIADQRILDAVSRHRNISTLEGWIDLHDSQIRQKITELTRRNGFIRVVSIYRCIPETHSILILNISIHERVASSIRTLIALRKNRHTSLDGMPKDLVKLIGQELWRTRGERETWSRRAVRLSTAVKRYKPGKYKEASDDDEE